ALPPVAVAPHAGSGSRRLEDPDFRTRTRRVPTTGRADVDVAPEVILHPPDGTPRDLRRGGRRQVLRQAEGARPHHTPELGLQPPDAIRDGAHLVFTRLTLDRQLLHLGGEAVPLRRHD